jgi:hypothetical protein
MKKLVIGTVAAFLLGAAALSSPAEARCWWNGHYRQCWHPHAWYHHKYYHHWGPYGEGYGWRY